MKRQSALNTEHLFSTTGHANIESNTFLECYETTILDVHSTTSFSNIA